MNDHEIEEETRVKLGNASILMLLLFIPIGIFQAFAISVLWGWFVVPLGAVALSTANAFGLLLMLMIIKIPKFYDHLFIQGLPDEVKAEGMYYTMKTGITIPSIALVAGWLAQSYM